MTLPDLASHLLVAEPDITGFYSWHLFTDKPIPYRHNGECNTDYVRKNWWRLKRKVREWVESQKTVTS